MVALRRNERARQGKPTSRRRADAVDAASGEQSSAPPEKRIICNSTDSRTDRGTILDSYRYVGITLAEALARLLSLPTVISQPPGGAIYPPCRHFGPAAWTQRGRRNQVVAGSDEAIGDSAPRLRSSWHPTAS
jgi:hypothetical protein